ncbi:serine hydrolase [Larkinella soli]|uniref:serine hydrolase n=1 Tax=Larkinella soli TaxID=1770527 RepID=UPI001E309958|nr:serine hydrolase [Larkinella soli]
MKILMFLLLPLLASAQPLTESLNAYLQKLPPTVRVSLAVESLSDSTVGYFHQADEAVPSASVIKIPILIEAMEWVKAGRINPDENHILLDSEKTGGSGILATYPHRTRVSYRDVMTLMMTHSDNTATNLLIAEIGMEAVNARMRQLGLTQSRLNRVMMDTLAARQGRENRVSCREMNLLLKKIYRRQVATPALCDEMLDILKRNEDTLTIRRFLPRSTVIAHKTGGLAYVRGDAGIVFAPRPFLFTAFVQGTNTGDAERIIGELAALCFKQFQ